MTEQELRKLSRTDLIEMMLSLSKENQLLKAELAAARKQLEDRTIAVEHAGSLAEAALSLNGVFEAAQAAASQYLQNIQLQDQQQKEIYAQMERQTVEKCDRMMAEARKRTDDYLQQAGQMLQELSRTYLRSVEDLDGGI